MQLTEEQIEVLNQAIELEAKTQLLLARARASAAEKVTQHFEHPEEETFANPAVLRLAIQFISRPFRPLTLLLQAASRQGQRQETNGTLLTAPLIC